MLTRDGDSALMNDLERVRYFSSVMAAAPPTSQAPNPYCAKVISESVGG